MSGLAAWRDLYTQRLTVEPVSGRDRFGNKTYGTAVTYVARVVGKRKQVLTDGGQMVVAKQVAYLFTADPVLPDSRLTLSTGDVGSTEALAISPPILSVGRFPDERGQHHVVLYLGG